MFILQRKKRYLDKVKGLIASIPYESRVPSANWSNYFGHYQNQKWGAWDSNSCWCLSAVSCLEDQLEWLWKNGQFSEEAKKFFTDNGYIDSDGDFSISERFLEIKGNRGDNGGDPMYAWILMQKYGCIPRDMLNYTKERAQLFATKSAFNMDYFNPNAVTEYMNNLGQQFLKYIKIDRQFIGRNWTTPERQVLKAALEQSPLQIGVPVPDMVSYWNKENVIYDGKKTMEHAIELYGIDDNGRYLIFDQYLPNLKTLSSDYYIPLVVQGVVTAIPQAVPNPIKQSSLWNSVWEAVLKWYNQFNPQYGVTSSIHGEKPR